MPATSSAGLFTLRNRTAADLKCCGVEQVSEDRSDLVAGVEVGPGELVDQGFPGLVDFVGDEELVQPSAHETGCGGLLDDDVYNVLAIEIAALAEEGLFRVVVVVGPELELPRDAAVRPYRSPHSSQRHVLGVLDCPSRERARGLLDVLLGVVADPHREELEQLATVVLVDGVLVVVVVVQPVEHRGIS